jgi:hypothetical protein
MITVTCGLLFLTACSETQESIKTTSSLPAPTLEDNHSIQNTEATYYIHWNAFEEDKPSSEGETLLRDLRDSGIPLKDVWFPSTSTGCAAPGAVTIAVVELSKPDAGILDAGFVSDPEEWWIINCGVAELWLYSFE